MADERKVMQYLLLSIRAAVEAALTMYDEEEPQGEAPPELVSSPDPAVCQHPLTARVQLNTMGSQNAWICGVCGVEGSGSEVIPGGQAHTQEP